jgi:hypothetical protein
VRARPSDLVLLPVGVLFALAGIVSGIWVIFDHSGGKFWFYWIAPLLMLATGAILIALTVGYWVKVVRLEVKGRPRSD